MAEAIQKTAHDYTRAHIELRLPADFSVLRWVAIGPHKLAAAPTVLRHFCNQKDPQARLEKLKLSKIDLSTWP
jgi:hypothetical protein